MESTEAHIPRETILARTFVELADTLVDEFDTVDFLHLLADRAVGLLGVDAAGLILADRRGRLRVAASTSQEARFLEVFQLLDTEGGPCLECYRTGRPQLNLDPDEALGRWPRFSEATLRAGFRSTHAIPLRLRDEVVGALHLLCADGSELSGSDIALAGAMADIATIGLLRERAIRRQELVSEQLRSALDSRVVIEQAKGVLAERASLRVEEAFELIRAHSRTARRPLAQVARAVLAGEVTVEDLHGGGGPAS